MATIEEDGLGDWRIEAATKILKIGDQIQPPNASVHKVTVTQDGAHSRMTFVTPSASAMALNIAIRSSVLARSLRNQMQLSSKIGRSGITEASVPMEELSSLYDYFEHSMIVVTFSFQAVESFCNYSINRYLKDIYTWQNRKGGTDQLTPSEVERRLSTMEKLSTVLPAIMNIKPPKGLKIWENFVEVERARDATIHIKADDTYPIGKIDKQSLFFRFLKKNTYRFPLYSLNMIQHFMTPDQNRRWLDNAREIMKDNGIV